MKMLIILFYQKISSNKFKTSYNPNTFVGLVGKVRKKLSPEGGRKGGWRKKARAARPGLEPGTCRVLGEGPQLHATGLFRQASLSVPIDRVGRLRNTTCCVFWR